MRCFNASILIFMYQHFENKARLNVNTENTSVALSVTKYFLHFSIKKTKYSILSQTIFVFPKKGLIATF